MKTIACVTRHGGKVHFARLTCSAEEQDRRIENPDRKQFKKLASRTTLHAINVAGRAPGLIPPSDLTIDTTHTPPADAAARIVAHFGLATVPSPAPA